MTTVVVPLDGSEHALVSLPVAKTLCALQQSVLHVVHVSEPRLPPRHLLEQMGWTPEEVRGMVIDCLGGTPEERILAAARELKASQIVLCSHTGLEVVTGGMGPIAQAILTGAACPVVLVPPARGILPWSLGNMLLPHDGTPTSAAAIKPAIDLANLSGAQLTVLHIGVPGEQQPAEPGSCTLPRYVDQAHYEWAEWAEEFLNRLAIPTGEPLLGRLSLSVGQGEASEEIVHFAASREMDLIVLAWRGSLDVDRAQTLKRVIDQAVCPVYVVRVSATGGS